MVNSLISIIILIFLFSIFVLFIVVVTSPLWLLFVNKKVSNGQYTQHQKTVHSNIMYTMILGIVLLIAITPTSERMTCDENLSCKVETGYLVPLSNRTEEFKVFQNSYIASQKEVKSRGSRQGYTNRIYFAIYNTTKEKPRLFKRYVGEGSVDQYNNDVNRGNYEAESIIAAEANNFQQYLKNPALKYSAEGTLRNGVLMTRIYMWVLLMIIIMFLNLDIRRESTTKDVLRNMLQKYVNDKVNSMTRYK